MLLIQLLSGVIPACQFVWAADLHNEFILASVLHTLPPSLPSLPTVPPSLSQRCNYSPWSLSRSLALSSLPSFSPPPLSSPLILLSSSLPSAQRAECLNANEPHFQTDATAQVCLAHNRRAPLRGSDKRWMDGDDGKRGSDWWKWREGKGFLEVMCEHKIGCEAAGRRSS